MDEVAEANEHQALLGARALFTLYEQNRKGAPREVAVHAISVIDALFATEKKRRLKPGSGESLADLIKGIGLNYSSLTPDIGQDIPIIQPFDQLANGLQQSNGAADPSPNSLLQSLGLLSGSATSELNLDFTLADEADFSGLSGWPTSSWIY